MNEFQVGARDFFSPSMGWPSLLYSRYCGLRPWGKGSGDMMKTTHFHLEMSLRMGAAVLLILLDVFMAWARTAL